MNKRVIAASVSMLLALVAGMALVPLDSDPVLAELAMTVPGTTRYRELEAKRQLRWSRMQWTSVWDYESAWAWEPGHRWNNAVFVPPATPWHHERICWPLLFAQQALIVALGAGMITYVVRRERRRMAAAV